MRLLQFGTGPILGTGHYAYILFKSKKYLLCIWDKTFYNKTFYVGPVDYGQDDLGFFARKSCHLGEVKTELLGTLEDLSSWEWPAVYQQYRYNSLYSLVGCGRGTGTVKLCFCLRRW